MDRLFNFSDLRQLIRDLELEHELWGVVAERPKAEILKGLCITVLSVVVESTMYASVLSNAKLRIGIYACGQGRTKPYLWSLDPEIGYEPRIRFCEFTRNKISNLLVLANKMNIWPGGSVSMTQMQCAFIQETLKTEEI